ncbi:glycosyltransferase [Streptococcus pluranimalium]|uniref:glycosyltransferase n=1 Tax=Streptococcus pluranimalium TaxID=82348 RepID=UPI00241568D5|nr:glycosyltransferase [Streptococcus pluranimalium]MDY3041805.1 glycosyltransferase [Streptococcus pluranimalium]WFM78994.1 glycosyltransferase [Streptococcus pluranimalium]HEM6115537.1 glycosyltransferase [Streptococcus suis]
MQRYIEKLYYKLFNNYQSYYVNRFKNNISKVVIPKEISEDIIVSFTTIPSRIEIVPLTIKSIFNQTVKISKLVMYVNSEEFAHLNLEVILRKEIAQGLEIVYLDENLRSHKKYYYALSDFSDKIVITIDDDVIYKPDMIEKLVISYRKYPQYISAMRCHKMKLSDSGEVCDYTNWHYEMFNDMIPSHLNFFTGCGGVLFPPDFRPVELFDKDKIRELSFLADDVWLNFMAFKHKVKVVKANRGKGTPINLDENLENSLAYQNVIEGNNNDICIKNMIDYYRLDFSGEK